MYIHLRHKMNYRKGKIDNGKFLGQETLTNDKETSAQEFKNSKIIWITWVSWSTGIDFDIICTVRNWFVSFLILDWFPNHLYHTSTYMYMLGHTFKVGHNFCYFFVLYCFFFVVLFCYPFRGTILGNHFYYIVV